MPRAIIPGQQYGGRTGPFREVISVRGETVLYVVGTRDGSREAECLITSFRRWATSGPVAPYANAKPSKWQRTK